MEKRLYRSRVYIPTASLVLAFFLFCSGCSGILHQPPKSASLAPICLSSCQDKEIPLLQELPLDNVGESDEAIIDTFSDEGPAEARVKFELQKVSEFFDAAKEEQRQKEVDKELDALDKAYALLITIDTDNPQLAAQKHDLRVLISKRIAEIYACRFPNDKENQKSVGMVMNSLVKKEVDTFMGNEECRNFFINAYKRSGRYRPFIVAELKKEGLPEELSWLALIESGFKPRALSKARALGLWQFTASTGRRFGLRRTRYIDQRLDPKKSTLAAIHYLKELHDMFGDWGIALAAYNCGEGRILKVLQNSDTRALNGFWDIYDRLPAETARYVPEFYATLYIVKNLKKYDLEDIRMDPPYDYSTVRINRRISLARVARTLHMHEDQLLAMNPELRTRILPGSGYELKVPPDKKEILLAKIDRIGEYRERVSDAGHVVYHRVRPDETLAEIARRYHTTVHKIAGYNDIARKNYIVAGQVLKIPQLYASADDSQRLVEYRVRPGDSLWSLARRYNTTPRQIKRVNSLKSHNLRIGQKVKIPVGQKSSRNSA